MSPQRWIVRVCVSDDGETQYWESRDDFHGTQFEARRHVEDLLATYSAAEAIGPDCIEFHGKGFRVERRNVYTHQDACPLKVAT